MYTPGDKVVIIRGPYKNKTGEVTDICPPDDDEDNPPYLLVCLETTTFGLSILQHVVVVEADIRSLTELGEVLYGPSNDGSKTP